MRRVLDYLVSEPVRVSAVLRLPLIGLIALLVYIENVDHWLPALYAAIVALYTKHLAGPWRWIYVVGAVAAQYFNVFVLVVQTFLKVPALHELAPNQNEPPFAVTQLVVLVVFAILGTLAVRRFHPTT